MAKIIAIIAVGVLTLIFWGILIHLLDEKIYNMFYKSKYASFEEYSQATSDKKNKFTPLPYYFILVVAFISSMFCTSKISSMFHSPTKTAAIETSVTNNEKKQNASLEEEKKKIEKEKQELEKQKKELEAQQKAAEQKAAEEAKKEESSPPPKRQTVQSNIPIEISDGRFTYYGDDLRTLRVKFNVTNTSSRTVFLSMDSFVIRKPSSNAIKPSHFGGGFSDTIDNPLYDNKSKDLFAGDTMAVCLDYSITRQGEGGWSLYYEHINQLIKVMTID